MLLFKHNKNMNYRIQKPVYFRRQFKKLIILISNQAGLYYCTLK